MPVHVFACNVMSCPGVRAKPDSLYPLLDIDFSHVQPAINQSFKTCLQGNRNWGVTLLTDFVIPYRKYVDAIGPNQVTWRSLKRTSVQLVKKMMHSSALLGTTASRDHTNANYYWHNYASLIFVMLCYAYYTVSLIFLDNSLNHSTDEYTSHFLAL